MITDPIAFGRFLKKLRDLRTALLRKCPKLISLLTFFEYSLRSRPLASASLMTSSCRWSWIFSSSSFSILSEEIYTNLYYNYLMLVFIVKISNEL